MRAQDPAISGGVRYLVYMAIGLDQTFQSSLWLTRNLVKWLLTKTSWMDEQTVKLCIHLVGMKDVSRAAG